ncbi:MAG: response regulator [Patescibacteria group bacterium]
MKKTARILVLEDDPDLLAALERQLAQDAPEWEVLGVRDGVTALSTAHSWQPHVIVLDLLVPQLKGLDMLKQLRQTEIGQRIPILVLTNFDESGFMSEAASLGVSDFLVKAHAKPSEVVERIRLALNAPVAKK